MVSRSSPIRTDFFIPLSIVSSTTETRNVYKGKQGEGNMASVSLAKIIERFKL